MPSQRVLVDDDEAQCLRIARTFLRAQPVAIRFEQSRPPATRMTAH